MINILLGKMACMKECNSVLKRNFYLKPEMRKCIEDRGKNGINRITHAAVAFLVKGTGSRDRIQIYVQK
jgi:hypothetical protein